MVNNSSETHGTLFVVATPIGNLDDTSIRARAMLEKAGLVLAEDTRVTRTLLAHFGLTAQLRSAHAHNEAERVQLVVNTLAEGRDVALVSDAGTPLISDPGFVLVRAVQDAGFRVAPVPGPSAVMTALSVAGLPNDRFAFEGFLPAKRTARRERLRRLATVTSTLVFFESPRRVAETVADLVVTFGPERPAAVARELTKVYEQVHRSSLGELSGALEDASVPARGEFVLVVGGASDVRQESQPAATEAWLRALLGVLSPADVARVAARVTGQTRGELYRRVLELKDA